jgi:hypothetical protein
VSVSASDHVSGSAQALPETKMARRNLKPEDAERIKAQHAA